MSFMQKGIWGIQWNKDIWEVAVILIYFDNILCKKKSGGITPKVTYHSMILEDEEASILGWRLIPSIQFISTWLSPILLCSYTCVVLRDYCESHEVSELFISYFTQVESLEQCVWWRHTAFTLDLPGGNVHWNHFSVSYDLLCCSLPGNSKLSIHFFFFFYLRSLVY